MADKRIVDFDTVTTVDSTDLFLIGGQNNTYNIEYTTLKDDVQDGMVRLNYGSSNAGKVLVVGRNGNVTLATGGSETVVDQITISANGYYTPAADVDGFSEVFASVPNTYTAEDQGKVVQGNTLVGQTTRNITTNGTYDTTTRNQVKVSVPNTYTNADQGKVVQGNSLASQTSIDISENGTYDTTLNNEVVVDVPNTFEETDEGKVVQDGELVEQTSTTVTQNGIVDTTLYNEVTVSVSGYPEPTGTISISVNGTHNVKAFANAVVSVPNAYSAADMGKVVSQGGLVAQTGLPIYTNGTYDTTFNNEVVVSVAGGEAFKSLVERTITSVSDSTITSVGQFAFAGCTSLRHVDIPNATYIGPQAFYCAFVEGGTDRIYFPNVVTISTNAFFNAEMSEVEMPELINVGNSAFHNCWYLKNLSLAKITSLSSNTFSNCSALKNVYVPALQSVSNSLFSSFSYLETVYLSSCSIIGSSTFKSCFRLMSLYLAGSSVCSLGSAVFLSTPISTYTTYTSGVRGTIYVPASLVDTYKSATGWKTFSSVIASIPSDFQY